MPQANKTSHYLKVGTLGFSFIGGRPFLRTPFGLLQEIYQSFYPSGV